MKLYLHGLCLVQEKNTFRFDSSNDQNFNSYERFRFVSILNLFDIEALLSKNIYDRWHPYRCYIYGKIY